MGQECDEMKKQVKLSIALGTFAVMALAALTLNKKKFNA